MTRLLSHPFFREGQTSEPQAIAAHSAPASQLVLPAVTAVTPVHLALLLDVSPDALIMIDAAGIITLMNAAGETLFGYHQEEVVGQPLECLLPERLRSAHISARAQYLCHPRARPMGVGLNLLGQRKDGEEFPVDISLRPIQIGEALYVIAAVRDVTAQRELQREREQLTERLRLQSELVNLAHDAILVHDPQGCILSWNQGANVLYGWAEQEALGQTTAHLLHTRFSQPIEMIGQCLADTGHWQGDLTHTRRDGRQVVVESRWEMLRDATGIPTAILEINRDVTEQRRLEQVERDAQSKVKAHLDFLQALLDRLPTGVFLVQGQDLRLILANQVAQNLWGAIWQQGQPMEDFLTQHGIILRSAEDRPLPVADTATEQAMISGEAVSQKQVTICWSDGTSVPTLVSALPLDGFQTLSLHSVPIHGERVTPERMVLAVYQDVAALKEAEALKDQFMSLATHELRTPVTVVAGYTDMMLRRAARGNEHPLDEWQIHQLHEMKQATQQLARLTEDVLDVTRLQGGQFCLHPCLTDLVVLTHQITDRLQATTNRHQISVHTVLPHFWVPVDALRIEQVLTNLLSNAIKYSPQGGPIEITLEENSDTHEARFRIRDYGMGIPQEQQAHMFERFVRAKNACAARIRGTGLGLYLCRELIERHGGHIWFESAEGLGTTFFFALPVPSECVVSKISG